MELEKAILKLKAICKQCHNSKECWNNEFCSDCYIEVEDVQAIETVLKALEDYKKENEELKVKQKMQEFKIDWCEKNTISKGKIKEIFSKYEESRKKGERVVGYWSIKEFVNKLLEGK